VTARTHDRRQRPGLAQTGGALQLIDVTKEFSSRRESVRAVDRISLDIEPGEFITLLGPSGCGKTTTLRVVAGFETATSGHVRLDGRGIERTPPQHRRMGMVFQNYALFPHLTVAENIAYGLRLQRRTRDEVQTAMQIALTRMNLVGMERRNPHELSGGEQQRVALARAMVIQPAVLLFDEPLSNLDAKLRNAMRTEIRRIQQMLGITSVYVTHDQDEAMTMSDRIVVMNKGRIEQVADPTTVYFRPASVFVADFIGRANFIEVAPYEIKDGYASVTVLGASLRVAAHENARAHGAGAYLMVRPEGIKLAPSTEGGNGTILRSAFHGHSVDYEVETSRGTLTVADAGPDPRGLLGEGVNVHVSIDPLRAFLIGSD
jgi:iron(III) transport system ATP-binding protein